MKYLKYKMMCTMIYCSFMLQMAVAGLKDIMLDVPKGFRYRTSIEFDTTFRLPSASHRSYLKKLAMHTRHRREVYDGISKTVDM